MVVFGPCSVFIQRQYLELRWAARVGQGRRVHAGYFSTGSMACSWTFKLCPLLSCLSSHSTQLTQDCQTDKFSPVHSEFLSWPTHSGREGSSKCAYTQPLLWAPRTRSRQLWSFSSLLNFASCALERCVTASLCPRLCLCSLMCPRPLCLPISSFQVVLATPTSCIHEKDSYRTELCYSAACLEAHLPHRHCFHNDPCLLTPDPFWPSDWLERSLVWTLPLIHGFIRFHSAADWFH